MSDELVLFLLIFNTTFDVSSARLLLHGSVKLNRASTKVHLSTLPAVVLVNKYAVNWSLNVITDIRHQLGLFNTIAARLRITPTWAMTMLKN